MTRDELIKRQKAYLDAIFARTIGEEETRRAFERLSEDSLAIVQAAGLASILPFTVHPQGTAALFLNGFVQQALDRNAPGRVIPGDLLRRWEAWGSQYAAMESRNPRLELHELLSAISETHDFCSWPHGYEHRISAWLDAGGPFAPPPFDDRRQIISPEFFERLRSVRQRAGGWFYWSEVSRKVIFAPQAEWRRIAAAHAAAEVGHRREREGIWGRFQRVRERLDQIAVLARADAAFWEAFTGWVAAEVVKEREARERNSLSGPIRIGEGGVLSKTGHGRDGSALVAPPFVLDFIDRVRQPGDEASVLEVLMRLRIEAQQAPT